MLNRAHWRPPASVRRGGGRKEPLLHEVVEGVDVPVSSTDASPVYV